MFIYEQNFARLLGDKRLLPTSPSIRQVLARRIAGDIILSSDPGATMKKWRQLFGISQMRLSDKMLLSSSAVISDYESGRRKSPGTRFVRRFVKSLLSIDQERGSFLAKEYANLTRFPSAAILDIREFPLPVTVERLCKAIKGRVVACPEEIARDIRGYTIVDTQSAMENLSGPEISQIFGATTERALIFTNIDYALIPACVVRFSALKPAIVVFHGTPPNELGVKLAEHDSTPLIYSEAPDATYLMKALRRLHRRLLRTKLSKFENKSSPEVKAAT